jgi:hypothetical protein
MERIKVIVIITLFVVIILSASYYTNPELLELKHDILVDDTNKLLKFLKDDNVEITRFSEKVELVDLIEQFKKIGLTTYIKESMPKNDIEITDNLHTTFYYMPNRWAFIDNALIFDKISKKYYVPEGLIKINKGSSYIWEKYTGKSSLNLYKFMKKTE